MSCSCSAQKMLVHSADLPFAGLCHLACKNRHAPFAAPYNQLEMGIFISNYLHDNSHSAMLGVLEVPQNL